jgi:aldehyde:ferredoxin oxidoreductase
VREWINASTGWALSLEDLLRIGHRVQVLRHCFNLREGIRPDDVSLPARASGHPPLKKGPLRSVSLDMGAMRQDYYRAMGYNERGMPTRELLESLGLSDIAEDLQVRNNASAPYGTQCS